MKAGRAHRVYCFVLLHFGIILAFMENEQTETSIIVG